MTVRRARILAAGVAAFALGLGRSARADEGRAVVVVVEGADSDAIAAGIASHVEPPNAVRDARAFRDALSARGVRALAAAVGNRTRAALLVDRAHAAASDAHVDVAILVSVRKGKRGPQAHLWVIDAHADGAAVDKELALGPAAGSNDEAEAAWAASSAIFPARSATPSPAPPPPSPAGTASPTPAAEAPATERDTATQAMDAEAEQPRARALLIAQLAMEAGSRHFAYVDRLTAELRPYDLFAAPVPSIAIEIYPAARTHIPFLSGLAVTGDYARAVGLSSADAGGTKVGTAWQDFDVGLRERIGVGRALLLGVNLGFGAVDFRFDGVPAGTMATLPSVGYRFLRAGLDLRGALGAFSLYGGGGYLQVLSAGPMGDLFPRESVGGVEARIGAAYVLARSFELSLGVGYTRFFYTFNPVPGDANVAGGALDEMARLSLGFAYLLL
jgi:hypothetical protein